MRKLIVLSALLLLCVMVSAPTFAQDETPEATVEPTSEPILYARVRVGHYAELANVDIYFNGERLMRNVPFGSMTNYLTVEAAVYEVLVVEAGASANEANAVLPIFNTVLMPERVYSLALIGSDEAPISESTDEAEATEVASDTAIRLVAIDEASLYDVSVNSGAAHVVVLSAHTDAINVALDGRREGLSGIPFGGYVTINHAVGDVLLNLEVMRDDAVLSQAESALLLDANALYFIVVAGSGENTQIFLQVAGTHNIAQYLQNSPNFTIIYSILESANLLDALQNDSPFTVFAPTNAAFEAWLSDQGLGYTDLLADSDLIDQLAQYHISRGLLFSSGISSTLLIPMIGGDDIAVTSDDGVFHLNDGVNITTADLLMTNGVIHVVGEVLNSPDGE